MMLYVSNISIEMTRCIRKAFQWENWLVGELNQSGEGEKSTNVDDYMISGVIHRSQKSRWVQLLWVGYDKVVVIKLAFEATLLEMLVQAVEDSKRVRNELCAREKSWVGSRNEAWWSYSVEIKHSESSRNVGKEVAKF